MELTALKNKIIDTFSGHSDDLYKILKIVDEDKSIFPFNEYELLVSKLINNGGLSFKQYMDIRTEYISKNPNLWVFEISAPRGFGEKFAQTYIQGICPPLIKPTKREDKDYRGEYDLWLDGIKIEVKASRAVDSESHEPLYMKALSRNTNKNFLMNFQQLKPQCCHVFVWVAVFRDQILLWVINSKKVLNHSLFSKGQHRGNKGNEGQLHITNHNINQLDQFIFKEGNLEITIRNAFLETN